MANLIYSLEGVRGRSLKLYDTKVVINTKKTAGSLITGNFTDGEKTLFLIDVIGVQFKRSGSLIGYLQFETTSMQMNNKDSNMFSENTFTFEDGKNGVTNGLMEEVYSYVVDRLEEIKYGTVPQVTISRTAVNNVKMSDTAKESAAPSSAPVKSTPVSNTDSHRYYTPEGVNEAQKVTRSKEQQWGDAELNYGVEIGKCENCGSKKERLIFVEYTDFFGTARKNICFDCFCKKDCKPVPKH